MTDAQARGLYRAWYMARCATRIFVLARYGAGCTVSHKCRRECEQLGDLLSLARPLALSSPHDEI